MAGEKQITPVNDTETDFPRDKCVHKLFETQVERTPNAVALVYDKEEVSYRELDNQAFRVARHLRSLGVGPDVAVGICVQRSTDMVHLSIRNLFEKPTVAEFAKQIERRTARPAPQRGAGLTRVSRDEYRVSPLSANAGVEMAKHI